ncbi:MAG: Rpn family recombination-promoting nuclease/putative transposase [Myxococcota bacterium]
MRFIDPRTDFAFKKIFGSTGHEGVLRSFLNAILYDGRNEIQELKLQDPYNIPRLKGLKDSYLDVRVRQQNGEWILIEMQVINVPGLEKRILFNAAKQYSNQLLQGEEYEKLAPVVLLTITDFVMFKDWPKIISRYRLVEQDLMVEYPANDVQLAFVELPKFTKTHDQATELWEKWLCFIKEANSLEMVPASLAQVPQIQEAFTIANYAKLEPEEADILDKQTMWWGDQRKIHKLYAQQQQDYEQIKVQRDQAQTERDRAQANEQQARQALRCTAIALRQSGLDDKRICQMMNMSQQQLDEVLTETAD